MTNISIPDICQTIQCQMANKLQNHMFVQSTLVLKVILLLVDGMAWFTIPFTTFNEQAYESFLCRLWIHILAKWIITIPEKERGCQLVSGHSYQFMSLPLNCNWQKSLHSECHNRIIISTHKNTNTSTNTNTMKMKIQIQIQRGRRTDAVTDITTS